VNASRSLSLSLSLVLCLLRNTNHVSYVARTEIIKRRVFGSQLKKTSEVVWFLRQAREKKFVKQFSKCCWTSILTRQICVFAKHGWFKCRIYFITFKAYFYLYYTSRRFEQNEKVLQQQVATGKKLVNCSLCQSLNRLKPAGC
jgi:hypothetical protein